MDKAEQELPRSGWRVDGVDIWPLIKTLYSIFALTHLMDNRDSQIRSSSAVLNKIKRVVKIFFLAQIKDRSHNAIPEKAEVLILGVSSTRYFKNDGGWYSPYIDTLQTGFNLQNITAFTYESTPDAEFRFPRFGATVLIQKNLLVSAVVAKVKTLFLSSALDKVVNWPRFINLIESELGEKYLPNTKSIDFQIRYFFQIAPYFRRLITNSGCRVCLMAGYYSTLGFALIKACREQGVRTIDIQHGVQGDAHQAYRSWKHLPPDDSNIIPDMFWTWGSGEKAIIDRWAQHTNGRHTAFVGGNPCLTIYDRQERNIITPTETTNYTFPCGDVSKVILFTCQHFDSLPGFVIQAMRLRPDFGWVLRIHPQFLQTAESIESQCQKAELNNVVIDRGDSIPLGVVMQCVALHITEFSSSVNEATAIGLRSIVTHSYGNILFEDQIKEGKACFVDTTERLIEEITKTSGSLNTKFARENEQLFKQAIERIAELIESAHKNKAGGELR